MQVSSACAIGSEPINAVNTAMTKVCKPNPARLAVVGLIDFPSGLIYFVMIMT
jgi:hypothetical protein